MPNLPSRFVPGVVALSLAVPLALHATPVQAQDNAAAVEALFEAGKKLSAEGKIAEACPKFLASYTLDHRLGTLLNLADCYEKNGQAASAWARFVEANTQALRAHEAPRAAFAATRAKALEPKLSRLSISVPTRPHGLTVTRDGSVIDPGAYGVDVPIDGGAHTLEASAPGMQPWSVQVTMAVTGDHKAIQVPPLVPVPSTEGSVMAKASPGAATRRTVGIVTAGVGFAGVGVGAAFGILALGKKSDANAQCGLGGMANACSTTGVDLRHTAYVDGNVSSVFIGVGAAAVVGGAALWLTGSPFKSKTTIGFDGQQLQVGGVF